MAFEWRNLFYAGDFKEFSHSRYRRHYFYYFFLIIFLIVIFLNLSNFTSTLHFPSFKQCSPKLITDDTTPSIAASRPALGAYKNPVASLDGIGYQYADEVVFKPEPLFETLNNLPACDLANDKNPMDNDPSQIVDEFHRCMKPLVEKFRNEPSLLSQEWVLRTAQCDKLPIWKNLQIRKFRNLHEIKWTILPKCKDENTMVTLGIGHDTKAEELLNRTLPNTKFYGADPMIDPNLRLYSAFGKFFPFAVGKASGTGRFRVLPNQSQKTRRYSYQDVTTIEFGYFLNDILKLQRIDIAWIDIEGGEFEFLDYFHRGGPLDQKKISVCQFNLEVHSKFHPPGEQIFHDFIFRVLEEGRYVFLKPMKTDRGVHRMYFINMEDKECVRKFIQ